MACRSPHKGEAVARELRREVTNASLQVESLDLAELDSVRDFAARLTARLEGLDVLINNAGVMAIDEARSADGFELTLATNHLGPAALSLGLLDLLGRGDTPRVTSMSSIVHWAGRVDLEDLNFERRAYRPSAAYAQSKLANLLFALELYRRLRRVGSPVRSLAAHPGASATNLGHEGSGLVNALMRHVAPHVLQGVSRGAAPMLRAALDPELAGGTYVGARYLLFGPARLERPARRARDSALASALFERTLGLVGATSPGL